MDTPDRWPTAGQSKRTVTILTAVTTLILMALLAAGLLGLISAVRTIGTRTGSGQWDPLGSYPEQRTGETTYRAGETVTVTGIKCSDIPVSVIGSQTWFSVEPAGIGVLVTVGATAEREAGCHTFEFVNTMPAGVVEAVNGFGYPVRMVIGGVETPFDKTDPTRLGVQRAWRTNPFTVVPTEDN